MVFSPGDRRIVSASTSSISVRQFPTKRGSRSARRFEAGICIHAVTRLSKICRGCSIQRSVDGCNTTGGIIARRYIPICVNWTARWPIGRTGNTKSCGDIYGGRHIGSRAFRVVIRSCSLTGRWACGVAPWREPYELRGSSTVLREPRGEIPRGYSPPRRLARPSGLRQGYPICAAASPPSSRGQFLGICRATLDTDRGGAVLNVPEYRFERGTIASWCCLA
jgi:hypothetical protein